MAAASPAALVVVPAPIVSQVTDLDIAPERVIGAQPEQPVELGDVRIHPLPRLSWRGRGRRLQPTPTADTGAGSATGRGCWLATWPEPGRAR